MSPDAAPHMPECDAYRRAYFERYGVISEHVCCCERIRRESTE